MRVSDVFARLPKWIATSGVFIGIAFGGQIPAGAGGPTTSIQTEYLMTMHAPLAVAQVVGQSLRIVNVPAGGWVEVPRIKGKILGIRMADRGRSECVLSAARVLPQYRPTTSFRQPNALSRIPTVQGCRGVRGDGSFDLLSKTRKRRSGASLSTGTSLHARSRSKMV